MVRGAGLRLRAFPLAHQAGRTGTEAVEGIDDVEEGDLRRGPGEGEPPALENIGIRKLLDSERGTIWAYSYGLGMDGPRHKHTRDAVVMWIVDDTVHVEWIPAGTMHSEEQIGVINEATIFELK